jgi:hypothetical protein
MLPACADVTVTTDSSIAAPTGASDHEAEDPSAGRLVNTALSLRAPADWIQSVSALVSGVTHRFWSRIPASGTCVKRRARESKAGASESALFWHRQIRLKGSPVNV